MPFNSILYAVYSPQFGNMSPRLAIWFCLLCLSYIRLSECQSRWNKDWSYFYTDYYDVVAPAARILDRKLPTGAMATLLQHPELVLEPNIKDDHGYIDFTYGRPKTYEKYVKRLDEIFKPYDISTTLTGPMVVCRYSSGYRIPDKWDEFCRFDLSYEFATIGTTCAHDMSYGFKDAQPCIFLFLDRIYNWVPEPYTNETVPDAIKNSWSPDIVTVKCEGTDPPSVDNLGDVEVHVSGGFHVKYFPFTGQHGWLPPVVAVQFLNPTPAVAIEVKCTLWAKNIMHRDLINTGSVTFQICVS